MATKSKLEQAVERVMDSLNDAQRELVKAQLSEYRQNKARMAAIDAQLVALEPRNAHTIDEVRMQQAQRASLSYERSQLAIANSRIATELSEILDV